MGIYENILNEDNTDAEAYWSIVAYVDYDGEVGYYENVDCR